MNQLTERLANLSPVTVIIVIAVLLGLRFALLQLRNRSAKSVAEIAESLAVAMGLVFLLIRPFFVQAFYIPSESMEPTLLGHMTPTPVHDHILVNKAVYRIRDPKAGEIIVFAAPEEAIRMSSLSGLVAEGKQTDYIKRAIAVEGDVIHVEAGYLLADGKRVTHRDFEEWVAEDNGELVDNIRTKFTDKAVYVGKRKLTDQELRSYLSRIGVDSNSKIEIHPGFVVKNGKQLIEPYTAEDPEFAYPDPALPDSWASVEKAVSENRLELTEQNGHQAVKIGKGEIFVMGDNRNHSLDSRFWGPLDRDRVLGRSMFIFFPFNRLGWSR